MLLGPDSMVLKNLYHNNNVKPKRSEKSTLKLYTVIMLTLRGLLSLNVPFRQTLYFSTVYLYIKDNYRKS